MKLETSVTREKDGIAENICVEAWRAKYPYEHITVKVIGEPTHEGRQTEAYRELRSKLGDDWVSDITDSWYIEFSGEDFEAIKAAMTFAEVMA